MLQYLRYSDIPLEEIQRICPACRGTCSCKVCLRSDNSIKVYHLWGEEGFLFLFFNTIKVH